MPSTYAHKALIEQLRNLSAEKTASENPSESALNTSHPSGDSSVDDDGTAPATTGARYDENTADDKAMNPSGTESAPTNDSKNVDDPSYPGVDAETDTSATAGSQSDPIANDPGTAHPVGKEATDALLKEASEIGAALRELIKGVEGDDSEESSDDSEEMAEDYDSEESSDGEEAAKDAAAHFKAAAAEIHNIESTLKQAADHDADAFATVLFSVLKQAMPASPEDDAAAEEILAQMAMADAAPAEEAPTEEAPAEEELLGAVAPEMVEEAPAEEAPTEEELLAAVAPEMAEEAPAEEELSPEEQMMLMQLLGSEGMAPDDVEAYGKMSALLDAGQISGDSMSRAQISYYNTCHGAAKKAQARFTTWKSSAALSNELNGIHNRGAK